LCEVRFCLPITRVWQKWRFSAPQTHLWLIKVWFSASTFVVKIATFAKPETVGGNAKPKQGTMKPELKRIRKVEYDIDPNRYELRSGSETNAPLCPYGNIYKWVVFDLKANEYVRFAKSVFKLLINKNGK